MFSWDLHKAIINLEKHGVSFEEAATAFLDAEGLEFDDLQHSSNEVRFKRLGKSHNGRILLIAYTVRKTKNGKETIRIITARCASRKERKAYQES